MSRPLVESLVLIFLPVDVRFFLRLEIRINGSDNTGGMCHG